MAEPSCSATAHRDGAENCPVEPFLRAARARAETETEATFAALARINHDLRTPLNAVTGFSTLLAERAGQLALEAAPHAARIDSGAGRLCQLLETGLDAVARDDGTGAAAIHTVDLDSLLAGVIDLAAPLAQRRQVTVRPPAPAGARVAAVPRHLARIAVCLLGTAIRHAPAGSHVDVATGHCTRLARVSIRAPGEGTAPADPDPNLAIAAQLIDRMGGELHLDPAAPGFLARMTLPV